VLAELAEYVLTPCPGPARRLGYLKEAVAIGARFRRQRKAWQKGIEKSALRLANDYHWQTGAVAYVLERIKAPA